MTFALKVMKKQHIVDNRQEEHIHSERRILADSRSPFIVKLVCPVGPACLPVCLDYLSVCLYIRLPQQSVYLSVCWVGRTTSLDYLSVLIDKLPVWTTCPSVCLSGLTTCLHYLSVCLISDIRLDVIISSAGSDLWRRLLVMRGGYW